MPSILSKRMKLVGATIIGGSVVVFAILFPPIGIGGMAAAGTVLIAVAGGGVSAFSVAKLLKNVFGSANIVINTGPEAPPSTAPDQLQIVDRYRNGANAVEESVRIGAAHAAEKAGLLTSYPGGRGVMRSQQQKPLKDYRFNRRELQIEKEEITKALGLPQALINERPLDILRRFTVDFSLNPFFEKLCSMQSEIIFHNISLGDLQRIVEESTAETLLQDIFNVLPQDKWQEILSLCNYKSFAALFDAADKGQRETIIKNFSRWSSFVEDFDAFCFIFNSLVIYEQKEKFLRDICHHSRVCSDPTTESQYNSRIWECIITDASVLIEVCNLVLPRHNWVFNHILESVLGFVIQSPGDLLKLKALSPDHWKKLLDLICTTDFCDKLFKDKQRNKKLELFSMLLIELLNLSREKECSSYSEKLLCSIPDDSWESQDLLIGILPFVSEKMLETLSQDRPASFAAIIKLLNETPEILKDIAESECKSDVFSFLFYSLDKKTREECLQLFKTDNERLKLLDKLVAPPQQESGGIVDGPAMFDDMKAKYNESRKKASLTGIKRCIARTVWGESSSYASKTPIDNIRSRYDFWEELKLRAKDHTKTNRGGGASFNVLKHFALGAVTVRRCAALNETEAAPTPIVTP